MAVSEKRIPTLFRVFSFHLSARWCVCASVVQLLEVGPCGQCSSLPRFSAERARLFLLLPTPHSSTLSLPVHCLPFSTGFYLTTPLSPNSHEMLKRFCDYVSFEDSHRKDIVQARTPLPVVVVVSGHYLFICLSIYLIVLVILLFFLHFLPLPYY